MLKYECKFWNLKIKEESSKKSDLITTHFPFSERLFPKKSNAVFT